MRVSNDVTITTICRVHEYDRKIIPVVAGELWRTWRDKPILKVIIGCNIPTVGNRVEEHCCVSEENSHTAGLIIQKKTSRNQ